jgi:hypothetical protein
MNKVSPARLKAYYEQHGFESDGRTENSMTREPQGPASTLNIGLHQGEAGHTGFRKMSKQEAQGAVESTGAKVTKSSVLTPNEHGVAEPTLVASTNRPLSDPEMQSVLQKTKKSAIPQRTDAGVESMHVAPGHEEIAKREGWDQFNPDYFRGHDGKTLSAKMSGQRGSFSFQNDNALNRSVGAARSLQRGEGINPRNERNERVANQQMGGRRPLNAEQNEILRRLSGQPTMSQQEAQDVISHFTAPENVTRLRTAMATFKKQYPNTLKHHVTQAAKQADVDPQEMWRRIVKRLSS